MYILIYISNLNRTFYLKTFTDHSVSISNNYQ